MNLLKTLASLFSPPPPAADAHALWLTLECHRCHEPIRARIDLRNDLSPEYAEGSDAPTGYYCRKVVMGDGRCFQQIELILKFNGSRRLMDTVVNGGKLLDEGKKEAGE